MNHAPSPFNRSGTARRLLVTLAIGSAAAAVTANVAFNDPVAIARAPMGTPVAQKAIAPPQADPSLPAADKALTGTADASGENATTF
jgi:hypothetical protein